MKKLVGVVDLSGKHHIGSCLSLLHILSLPWIRRFERLGARERVSRTHVLHTPRRRVSRQWSDGKLLPRCITCIPQHNTYFIRVKFRRYDLDSADGFPRPSRVLSANDYYP